MVNSTRRLLLLALSLVACERKSDGTMRLVDRTAPPPVSPAEEPPVAINPVSPVHYPRALLEQGIEGQTRPRGTPQYMPPEQILGSEVDGRTDLYALGISIFEGVTGLRPFRGEDVVNQQLHDPLPDPRTLRSEVPPGLVAIIQRACQKEAAHRFQSAREMADALSTFLKTA